MKLKTNKKCDCSHPEIKETHPEGCTLNQIIKCHGEQPINKLLSHIPLKDEED
jgi:hypothetical protein